MHFIMIVAYSLRSLLLTLLSFELVSAIPLPTSGELDKMLRQH